ncbi:CBS domain-containing protein [Geminicoccaceae bacterium 1502E]|nr:CBS domain-containing protein [Geminicoccaceae bacterium 1502E]
MQAQDVMTTRVVTVGPDAGVGQIADLMVKHRISAVPVVDDDNMLLGIVSEGDLLHRFGDEEPRRSWWLDLLTGPEDRARDYLRSHGRRAGEIMTSAVVTVTDTTPLSEVARLLEEHHVKRLPVLRDGRLAGVVSRADIVRALAVAGLTPPTVATDDRSLRQAVLAEIDRAGLSYHPYVNIVVSEGVVHLWGFVESRKEADALALACSNVGGVKEVDSHLAVRRLYTST